MGLLYMLTLWSNECVIWTLDPMVVLWLAALTGGYYRIDIISGVGHLMSNSVMPLVFCTIAYNIWDSDVVLQVPWDSTNLAEEG
jgi:hypothetical protein